MLFPFSAVPHEFTTIPFPVKALKILLHDLQAHGDAATITARHGDFDADSDDGVSADTASAFLGTALILLDQDEEWEDDGKLVQGFTQDEFAFLSDMIGPTK